MPLSEFEWLRGPLKLYLDPNNGRYWVCKAKSSDGSVYALLYLDTILQIPVVRTRSPDAMGGGKVDTRVHGFEES